ncbi:DMT family transporter [Demequina sp. B12]|uniref:DMT family transporter n=1 Tax=Demequina sp. B12 TaxID=2992757 RepID=UPI00237C377E|nr:DMT family transporter [Demequina sp. B12]MDE0571928.1 DMT family transporter [Demequina sp. B12]
MTTIADAPLRTWLPYFLGVSAAWGCSFLFIEVALREFAPAQVAFGRVFFGAVTLMVMVLVTGNRPALTWKKLGAVALVAAFMSAIPLVLIPAAQQHISSILASLLNATTPLWTAMFVALLIPTERVSRLQLAGLVLGAGGIAILLGAWRVDDFPLLGAALMLGATACYGIGSTLSRLMLSRVKDSPMALSSLQITVSAFMLSPVALAAPQPAQGAVAWGSWPMWAIVALGVTGTSFAYVWFWKVVQVAGATTAASVTYCVPVVATALGVLVLGETLAWFEVMGALVVFAGVWLAQRRPKPRPEAIPEIKGSAA